MADDKKVIYSMVGISKKYNQNTVLKDIYLSYFYGAKIGVLGLNGAGKSTLLRILAGEDKDFIGETVLSEGFTIGYLEQESQLDPEKTVREIVEEGAQEVVDLFVINGRFGEEMTDDEMDQLLNRQGKVQDKLEALDAESVAWLEHHLKRYEGTIIAVTHDRYFLDNVAGWILELDKGEGIPWRGNYSSWLEQKQKRLSQEEKQESDRQKTLKRELEWIKMSPKGRHAKSKSRINSYETLLNQDSDERDKDLLIYIPPGPRLGNVVIEADNIKKAFDEKLLYEDLTFKLPPGGIVGIIGPNGAGKTTLFKMITGQDKPDSGTFKTGETVVLSYMDQMRDRLDGEKSVWEILSNGQEQIKLGKRLINSRAYAAKFNFQGANQQKKVGVLSGGERNRINLAMMLKEEANVLLLDEPTNDLDVNTIRALEDAILNFAGSVVVISHDRWFLDRIATHILAFEGESQAYWFEGNYSEYEENRKKRLGLDAETPHRIKYRSLTRD